MLLHALVVDENGEKMSKVKGNVIDPLHLVYGAKWKEMLVFPQRQSAGEKELDEQRQVQKPSVGGCGVSKRFPAAGRRAALSSLW